MSRLVGMFLGVLALVIVAAPARADPPPRVVASLVYVRGAGAAACPDEAHVREAMAVQFGYDPFTAGPANTKIELTIARERGAYVGRWSVLEDGAEPWVHEPESHRNCTDLIESAALSVAFKMDPAPTLPGPAPAPPPEPVVREAPAPAPPPPAPPRTEERSAPPPPLPVAPEPGVFAGRAGMGRAAGFAVAGVALASGVGFAVAAHGKEAAAGEALDGLAKAGSSPCFHSAAPGCTNVAGLLQAHDRYQDLAEILLVAAGTVGVATTASIVFVRTPVQIKPTAPGTALGLTVEGRW